ncbi:MAG: YeiH family protein [Christensenella hongkongensis]|uniref:YeiH family protein n=1 Tax=Christensenella hongkongensis TaxID=270498 RepID=UPI002A750D45|nr:YeiH family protein [Christensenella hongkongensis]MDY3003363.1 YeiH family protein [Christensenella hongkongensis]
MAKVLKNHAPGVLLSVAIAVIAMAIGEGIPNNIISSSVFALLIGMALNPLLMKSGIFGKGVNFTSKQILKLSIILMGVTLSFAQVMEVGKYSLVVMCFTLAAAFAGGYFLGKLFKVNWKMSSLISVGTGICGGSAIAAVAPAIDAEDDYIAYSISAIFLFDIIMVVIFPLMGRALGLTDMGYGLWTGTAVNDTSAVVAAGYAFSDAAGGYAMIVKLTRTLAIIPVVLIFSVINLRIKRRETLEQGVEQAEEQGKKLNIAGIIPWFIIGFLVMVGIKSAGLIPDHVSTGVAEVSKFMMVMALGAIGLSTSFKNVAKSGVKPLIHGSILSVVIVLVSYAVQVMMGQV